MTLADKIVQERKKRAWSQEELAERLDVTRQSVSKWESGLSVPDLDKIVALSKLFLVSCDYLLQEETAADAETAPITEVPRRPVSAEEVSSYVNAHAYAAPRIAWGVFLCIVGVAILVACAGLTEAPWWPFPETGSIVGGLLGLLVLVAVAVALFVLAGMRLSPFQYWTQEPLELLPDVRDRIKEARAAYRITFTRFLVAGILLCILSLVPLCMIIPIAEQTEVEYRATFGVALLLLLIAAGVACMVYTGILYGQYSVLLEEGEYRAEAKQAKKRSETVMHIFWLVVLAGYLLYSFLSNDWGRSWVVWPVAGVLSGIIELIFALTDRRS